ncbi:MAG: DUF5690 family protein [Gemmatimonadaceae bacterium]
MLAHPLGGTIWSVVAAFGVYGSMYAFRKPFTAAVYLQPPFGPGTKATLVLAQMAGYMAAKFLGIRVVAGLSPARRGAAILALVAGAELALLLFALLPPGLAPVALALNGLSLGMVYSLVVGFLEGRQLTEALLAGLVASFIVADGLAKALGSWLLQHGVPEAWMPVLAGASCLPLCLGFLFMLQRIPPPDAADVAARAARVPMAADDRRAVFTRWAPGLTGILLAFLLVTVLRSLRADFAPELWGALGVQASAMVYARSEAVVACAVLAVNGAVVLVRNNRQAFFLALTLGIAGIGLLATALVAQQAGTLAPFPFIVLTGVGLALPYAAVHTTVFERLIAVTRDRANMGWLMSIADACGYLGYVTVMLIRTQQTDLPILTLFRTTGWIVTLGAGIGLVAAAGYFQRAWRRAG